MEAITVAIATAPSKKKKSASAVKREDKDVNIDKVVVGTAAANKKKKKAVENVPKEKGQMYYLVSCKDNGCGTFDTVLLVFFITLLAVICF